LTPDQGTGFPPWRRAARTARASERSSKYASTASCSSVAFGLRVRRASRASAASISGGSFRSISRILGGEWIEFYHRQSGYPRRCPRACGSSATRDGAQDMIDIEHLKIRLEDHGGK
jgi:hypothetical protein